ncbi:MAG: guanylate kinase [Gammaproteobacteria bacterium]|nr:guanylate kinase [Gammaproteobacteria bacterium]
MKPSRGQLLIISAPSGAGKTSLIKALVDAETRIEVSVSHTTRPMRPGERDGINYYFVSEAEFLSLRDAGAFFEWAEVFGNFYGTGIAQLEARLAEGADVILEIDWQGAQQVRRLLPDSAWAFILPPSVDALKLRLQSRGQDNDNTIDVRMGAARSEISHWEEADYLIINDDFDTALTELRAVVHSLRLRTSQQRIVLDELINSLLAP